MLKSFRNLVLRSSGSYKNHPCAEEFNVVFVYGTYILDGETSANFSLSETWNLLQDEVDPLPSNTSIFCRQMIYYMRATHYIQATSSSGSPLSVKIFKHAHKIMIHGEKHRGAKDILMGNTECHPCLQGITFLQSLLSQKGV